MLVLVLAFAILVAVGTPVAIAMIASSGLVIWQEGIPLSLVVQRVFAGLQSFPLLAVPLFTLAGSLMNESGISERLFAFTRAIVGHIRGGLAQTAIVGNVFLSGISGSSIADTAATTRVLTPQLERNGYSRAFGAALSAAAGTLGPIIPPSILMVLYAWQANVSLGALFIAGLIPGVVMAGTMAAVIMILARIRNYPTSGQFRASVLWTTFKRAIWALLMPVIIIVGFRLGAVTATEIAGVAALYSALVGIFVYRTLKWSSLPRILTVTARETAVILIIAGAASPFSWILGIEQAPQLVVNTLTALSSEPWVILLILNLALLVVGMFVETIAVMIILVPILIPLLTALQIDLVHFGIVLLVNLVIGQLTPPVGVLLFVSITIAKVTMGQILREIWPFFLGLLVALGLITYLPGLSLWLPHVLGF
ncbi:MAG TPA: TRAP transporter large permease [Geminicoccus sp.]|uniref:TRAP transporter large permease n=1 Tax=Geminicoccus sp. TaxID=2024832 RepID=UPI002C7FDFFF|nr:TRAP transporter large permease [Geminicoccus sp.]HWL71285.1 TRAP transporter large permease [Geminicoccus sp.]